MVGVIGLSTANVLERLRVAYDLGFREFQFSLPSWSPLVDAEVYAYVQQLCYRVSGRRSSCTTTRARPGGS